MNKPFATSQLSLLTPMAIHGIRATDCHDQIRTRLASDARFLAERGMPDAASFLAEPVHDPSGRIDWYTDLEGRPVPATSLSAEQQAAVRRRLAACDRALEDLARSYDARDAVTAAMIRLVTRHPSAGDVYVCDGRLVLINWGFAPGDNSRTQENIMRLGAAPPPPPPAAPAEEAAPKAPEQPAPAAATPTAARGCVPVTVPPAGCTIAGCASWLPVLLLLALLLWLVGAILGHFPSPLPAGCFRDPVSMNAEEERAGRLAVEADTLARNLQDFSVLCVPAPTEEELREPEPEKPPVEEPKEPGPEPVPPLAEADIPFFGGPDPEPEPEPRPAPKAVKPAPKVVEKPKVEAPKQEPKPQRQAKGEAMQIPRDAAKRNDLSFLEGCWRSVTDLYNSSTGRPIEAEYCFRADGTGRRFVYEEDGSTCSGSVRARFNGNRLDIRSNGAQCQRGSIYVPQDIQCNGTGRSTECHGKEHIGSGGGGLLNRLFGGITGRDRWQATFVRK